MIGGQVEEDLEVAHAARGARAPRRARPRGRRSSPFSFRRSSSSSISPTRGDSLDAERGEVAAGDLEPDAAQLLEIAARASSRARLQAAQREREQRSVGVVGLDRAAGASAGVSTSLEPLDEPRGDRHRVGDASASRRRSFRPPNQSKSSSGGRRRASTARRSRQPGSSGAYRARSASTRPTSRTASASAERCGWIAGATPSSPRRRTDSPDVAPPRAAAGARRVAAPTRARRRGPSRHRLGRARRCGRPSGTRTGSRSGSRGRCASDRR